MAHGAFNFRVAGVADQNHLAAAATVATDFGVDLGDQRTGGVKDLEATPCCLLLHRPGDAVSAENHGRTVRNLIQFLNEDRATPPQIIDDETVMHDFMADIDRRAEQV